MINVVIGTQRISVKASSNKLAKNFVGECDNLNFVRFDGESTLIQECVEELNYLPLGYDKKAVVIDNCYFLLKPKPKNKIDADQDFSSLISYIKSNSEDSCLILSVTGENFDRNNEIIKLATQINPANIKIMNTTTPEAFSQYCKDYIKNKNINIETDALLELIDRVGDDIALFQNNINKLCLYTNNITYNDVILMVSKPLEDNAFLLFDYLMRGKNELAVQLFRDLRVSNTEPVTLIGMLATQFRLMSEVAYLSKLGKNNDEIAKELNIKPGKVYIVKKNLISISSEQILKILDDLYKLDYEIKSGSVDRFYSFELFLIKFKKE